MKIGPSIALIANNCSFGLIVNQDVSLEEIKKYPGTYIKSESAFAGCSGYTRYKTDTNKMIFFVPVPWVPERFNNEEFFRKWEEEMRLMGGNAHYLGKEKYLGRYFSNGGLSVVGSFNNYNTVQNSPGFENSAVTADEWYVWEINSFEYNNATKNYHSFCLFRYLWSRHFNRIIDYYFEIKKKLCKTNPEPIEILQLAMYTFDYQNCLGTAAYTQRYHVTYSHLNLTSYTWAFPILKQEEIELRFGNHDVSPNLQAVFSKNGENLKDVTYSDVLDLINKEKYKSAYELLRKK